MSEVSPSPPVRKVGVLLWIGIVLIPIIFAWFTLRQGHSTWARALSFVWLVVTLVAYGTAVSGPGDDPHLRPPPTPATSTP